MSLHKYDVQFFAGSQFKNKATQKYISKFRGDCRDVATS